MMRIHVFYGQGGRAAENISKLVFETKLKIFLNSKNSIPENKNFKYIRHIYIVHCTMQI